MDPERVVLITGGAGGMGRSIARRFQTSGHHVVLSDRSRDGLEAASRELGSVGVVEADVASVSGCERMIAETVTERGRLDVLVNAAGVWVEGPTSEMTEAAWDHVIDVNLKGTFFACRSRSPS